MFFWSGPHRINMYVSLLRDLTDGSEVPLKSPILFRSPFKSNLYKMFQKC